jgi:N-acetylneuraminic acid mutarotase
MSAVSRRAVLTGLSASIAATACSEARTGFQATDLGAGWQSGPDLPIRVQEIYPAALDGIIYVAGGLSPDEEPGPIGISDRLFALNTETGQWRERARLPIATHHPNLIAIGDRIWSIGGFNAREGGGWTMSRTVRTYDPERDRWESGPDMPYPFAETTMGVINGRLHVVTGRRPSAARNRDWTDHADTNAHIVLDPATGNWTGAAPAPTARNSAAAVVLNDRLHVIGGRTVSGGNTLVHEIFDASANRWTKLAPLPVPSEGPHGAGGLASAVIGEAIYVFGGEWFDNAGGGVYTQVWAYDSAGDT